MLSIFVQAAARRKSVLFATLFFLVFAPYHHEVKWFSFTAQIYAQGTEELVIVQPKGAKRKLESENPAVLSSPAHRENRFEQSATCLLPADIPEQRYSEKFSSFRSWLVFFKEKARQKGISSYTVESAFKNVRLLDKVVQLDRKQAEYSRSFTNYINNSISLSRITRGKRKLQENATILRRIHGKYGIPPEILVALWGMESDFGGFTGNFSTINTLATLAYDGRRRDFFTNELLCALAMLDSGSITVDEMTGSWAGAMGQPQFMPSTFQYYAVDGNGDGKKDIWQNTSDVLASAANYLYSLDWKRKDPWVVEVALPENFDPYHAKLSVEKSLKHWRSLGVKKPDGKELRGNTLKGSIILPAGLSGPAFLVFHNFRVIREWNKSMNYALAVGHLAYRIAGGAPLTGLSKQKDKNLSHQDAFMIQQVLSSLGYYTDKIDGMVGLKSREAIREYQKEKGIPADGYPSEELIIRLRQEHP
uniref:lytic murein transglycosylase n=1 Tax=Candidatus Electrothrix sp. TaxID=2170559 RepID=UPI0040577F38